MSTLTRIITRAFGHSAAGTHDTARTATDFTVAADERGGYQPLRRRSRLVRRAVTLSALLGASWGTYTDPTIWPRGWSIISPYASTVIDAAGSAISSVTTSYPAAQVPSATKPPDVAKAPETKVPDDRETARPAANAPEPVTEPRPVLPATPADETPARVTVPTSKTATAAPQVGPGDAYTAPAPRRAADEPNRRRAEAAGLHPDLSPAILQRLTDADYKSAATAIRKALTEVDDDGVIIWPEKPRAERALFQISFVPGAASTDCRRYIVAIAKDGWRTTALPVEKCGVKRTSVRKG